MNETHLLFNKMMTLDHLFLSWNHCKRGKHKRKDIQSFERHLEDNIFQLRADLSTLRYKHGSYQQFYITDPKQRYISKATVRDRVVHQLVYNVLNEVFDNKFIFHSLSSRIGKGTHVGGILLQRMIRKVSGNGTRHCFALKMDIKRFFDSIDHKILKGLLRKKIYDEKLLKIVDVIIDSFQISKEKGIPLGNVTSQIFANIYLHELDLYIKHELKERDYLRYCDDFVILSSDECHLKCLISRISEFLALNLKLELHPRKIILRKLSKGIDFIGYIHFAHHILLRTRTEQRMKSRLKKSFEKFIKGEIEAVAADQQLQSYLGILSHANQHALSQAMKNSYWVRNNFY
jgi:RNA-directed DNA polymerase